jgi:arylsulfatase A-like enzyme
MTEPRRPNILFIMADDHAARAISAYGGGLNHTANIDRLADEGMRHDATYVTTRSARRGAPRSSAAPATS